jgi:hypothetical protein
VVYLGSRTGVTPSVIAAAHPSAEVYAWDHRPGAVEKARRLREEASLDNLVVHERPELPTDYGAPADFVVVEGVVDSVSEELRSDVFALIERVLRPGGLVAMTFRTIIGWAEIVPVQRLIRYLATRDASDPTTQVRQTLELLARLATGGASYLAARPRVTQWLDELRTLAPADIVAEYVERDLRPVSHAQVSQRLAEGGCHFVGSAHLLDDLGLDIPPGVVDTIATAPTRALREWFGDLAVRRAHRCDVFRLGSVTSEHRQVDDAVAEQRFLTLRNPPHWGATVQLGDDAYAALAGGEVTVADLGEDPDAAAAVTRALMSAGVVHPAVSAEVGDDASTSARALTAALTAMGDGAHDLVVSSRIGSAVERSSVEASALQRLGAT